MSDETPKKLGRPLTYTLEYLAKEAEKLDKFEGESLYEFTYDKPYLAQDLTEYAQRSPIFRLALIKAKERLAHHRTKLLNEGKLHVKAYGRCQHVYDKITLDLNEQLKDRESERRKNESSSVPTNDAAFDNATQIIKENYELKKRIEELEKLVKS